MNKLTTLRQLLENENYGKIWLILADGETAGHVVLTFGHSLKYGGRDALIDELSVRENFRGCGIGKQTIAFVAEFCRLQNIKAVYFELERANIRTNSLYYKTGDVDRQRHFFTKWI